MRKNQKMYLLAGFALVTMICMGAASVIAEPTFSDNCAQSGCHTDNTQVGLSSNATGTVQATQGVPFVLVIDADSGVGGIAIPDNVGNNDQFSLSDDRINDEDAEDTNAISGEITTEVTVTPLAAGTFTLQIWAMNGGTIGTPLDITVEVEASTTTPTSATTTTTTQNGLSEEERIELWYTLMMILIPATGVILVILGFVVIRRTNA
ncbi:MAG: hypothetical protein ACFFAY_12740 [Promethearchaeota archaeon]